MKEIIDCNAYEEKAAMVKMGQGRLPKADVLPEAGKATSHALGILYPADQSPSFWIRSVQASPSLSSSSTELCNHFTVQETSYRPHYL